MIRFIRIYTPFICTLMTFVNALFIVSEIDNYSLIYLFANLTGNSILMSLYMICYSLRMCIWYKLNLICLLLTQLISLSYNYFDIDTVLYLWIIIMISSVGIICFAIFRYFYKVK